MDAIAIQAYEHRLGLRVRVPLHHSDRTVFACHIGLHEGGVRRLEVEDLLHSKKKRLQLMLEDVHAHGLKGGRRRTGGTSAAAAGGTVGLHASAAAAEGLPDRRCGEQGSTGMNLQVHAAGLRVHAEAICGIARFLAVHGCGTPAS